MSWRDLAACRPLPEGVDFFPSQRGARDLVYSENKRRAKAICATCPVLAECREWAIVHERFGIWGGLTERERRDIQVRKRRPGVLLADADILRDRTKRAHMRMTERAG